MFKERSSKATHPLNPSVKRIYRRKIIPLSEELRREKLAGTSSSKNDYLTVESLMQLVKSEIHTQINKLNLTETFVKKSEIDALRNFLLKGKEIDFVDSIRKSISADPNNDSEFETSVDRTVITNSGESTLKLLEQAFIAEAKTASSESGLEIPIGAMNYIQDEITNTQSQISKDTMCPSQDKSSFSEQDTSALEPSTIAIKNIEDRIASLEIKVNSLYKLVEKIASLKKQQIKLQKITYKHGPANKLEIAQGQAERQQAIVAKLNAIEQNMQQVFFESSAVQKVLFDTTTNPYDEKYYEWRQRRKNMLTYKKSSRSISLNRRPKIEQFNPPMPIKPIGNKNAKAHFLSTPSRTDNKV